MRETFQKWLFVFVASAFLLIFALSYYIQTDQAQKSAIGLIQLKISDAEQQLIAARGNLARIEELTRSIAIFKARAFARILDEHPEILQSQEELEKTRLFLHVDEVHVSDGKGILIASVPAAYKGYNMASADQSAEFMPALTDPDFALVQKPRAKGINNELFQYAGVARHGTPGIVQVGFQPRRLQEATRIADIHNIANAFRIGIDGTVLLCKGTQVISSGTKKLSPGPITQYGVNSSALRQKKPFTLDINGEEYLGLAMPFAEYTIVGILPKKEMYLSRNAIIFILIVVNLILFGVVFVLVSVLVQRLVISGIYKVNDSLSMITAGDLNEKVNVHNSTEFSSLSHGINSTVEALKQAISDAAARIDAELEFAKAIQFSALPRVFPPYPDRTEFDIFATMRTAKEVGGDFYDFFLVDQDHLVFLIADVSGKGIPAALFMMEAKTQLKNLAESGMKPAAVFTEANKRLCANNEHGMFVTAFFGELEISTGKLVCVNAGHNPPLLRSSDGRFSFLKFRRGLVLGAMENTRYHSHESTIMPGDDIFLYTDGVTEAQDVKGGFFGEDRLLDTLNSLPPETSPKESLSALQHAIDAFSADAEQADDITLLCVKYCSPAGKCLELDAVPEALPKLLSWLSFNLDKAGVPQTGKTRISIAAEEIFVNIAHYAYVCPGGKAFIAFDDKGEFVSLTFTDAGFPFNPLEHKMPDVTLEADERTCGGLGIFMVKNSMDSIDYRYENGHNILTFQYKKNRA